MLGQCWDEFDIMFEQFNGALRKQPCTTLGQRWNNLETIVGPLWEHFGIVLGQFGDNCRTMLEPLRQGKTERKTPKVATVFQTDDCIYQAQAYSLTETRSSVLHSWPKQVQNRALSKMGVRKTSRLSSKAYPKHKLVNLENNGSGVWGSGVHL